ncbi:putative phosphoesterase [Serratia entomophila]|uniref:metallophosphoesterase n=1 Tax=Serratia entomophila TaxID=42906 RepID=UPI001F3C087D|nr:metallophosphoesterase [Serratia entomophila]UIW17742.1 metallophosphatase family protein [Serratia entomophila]CAI0981181.1 putative phosphoesterase [Serratia entomophila]CAI0982047.1 putative phosphoesterase [Serratia entomophila]CAI0995699.1 putative phosphoesterase [Serratia entomophila]CAI1108610.1 putative phosphoesterase [Serratia entomophila]
MKVYAISDLHIDFDGNAKWFFNAFDADYTDDVLLVAGDVSDELNRLEQCFTFLARRFKKVLFVPGNHELWVIRDSMPTSIRKFEQICQLTERCGVSMDVYHHGSVSIVPLLSWYDFSFSSPTEKLLGSWMDFHACKWPDNWDLQHVTNFFLDKNISRLNTRNDVVISFSHFLPTSKLLPNFVPEAFKYIFPVLGSEKLAEQISILQPDTHVYGHSHISRSLRVDDIDYVNNALGYPKERGLGCNGLYCLYNSEAVGRREAS